MPSAAAGPEIERLIQLLARLPGLGPRSARRAALHLIKKREQLMAPLAAALETALARIEICRVCGSIDSQNPCTVCTDARRDPGIIVVVADVADLWALERAQAVNGHYHVLGGTLSPLEGPMRRDAFYGVLDEQRISVGGKPYAWGIPLAFPATVVAHDGGVVLEAHFELDRTRWGASYGSGRLYHRLGMHLVNDAVSLGVRLIARP